MGGDIYSEGISLKNKRQSNMDRLLLCENTVMDMRLFLAAVCDGVGSTRDGAYAAEQALKMLQCWFYSLKDTESIGLHFLLSMKKINMGLSEQILRQRLEAATTFSGILLAEDRYYLVHAGDSRIYGWKKGCIKQLTQDCVSEQGALSSYLGRKRSAVFLYCEGKNEYEKYLLCTDGFYRRIDKKLLEERLAVVRKKNVRKTLKLLTEAVILNGEKDNVTLGLIINERGGEE